MTVAAAQPDETIQTSQVRKNTFEEYGEYAWDEKAAERGEDIPLKTSDHAMDATRYFVHTVLAKSRAHVKDKAKRGLH